MWVHRLCFLNSLGLGCFVVLISYFLFNLINFSLNDITNEYTRLINNVSDEFSSSVWCVGSNNSDRFCTFKNLCYSSDSKEFVFYHGPRSVIFGVPIDRFEPALAELSSVKDHNVEYFNYVDLPASIFQYEDSIFIKTPALLFNRFHPENLMHIFHDDLLPLYSTLGMICKDNYDNKKCNISVVFVDGKPWGRYSYLYKALFQESFLIQEFHKRKLLCFKEAHVGVNKQTVWYQYGFKVPQGPVGINLNEAVVHINNFKQYFERMFPLPTVKSSSQKLCIILTRKTSRLILNIDEIIHQVANISSCNVKQLNLEKYTVFEIVSHLKRANVVLGMHGSLLILSIFLRPSSILIELFPYAVNPSHYTPYKTLASLTKIIYESWQNTIEENTVIHPENPQNLGGITHLPKMEQDRIVKNQQVPLHLCCENPEWLFRIYQDTVVNLTFFQAVLERALYRQNNSIINKQSTLDFVAILYPSTVRNPFCQLNVKNNDIHIQWEIPWNLLYWKAIVVEYELLIQSSSGDDVNAYILPDTSYIFKGLDTSLEYHVWVRCIADGNLGPFSNVVKCM